MEEDKQMKKLAINHAKNLMPDMLYEVGKPSKYFKGRKNEVAAVKESLLKKRIRSCVLVGKSGVGKTEIVRKAVKELDNKDIVMSLDVGSLIRNCTLVGLLEERTKTLIKKILDHNKTYDYKIVLFIDEIHALFYVGKNDYTGSVSVGELLKPYLADGRITIIGATTNEEFKKYILADKALLRRLPPIFVDSMGDGEILSIVKEFGGGALTDKQCEMCVELGKKVSYLQNPDSALEIADRAIAKAMANLRSVTEEDIALVTKTMTEVM